MTDSAEEHIDAELLVSRFEPANVRSDKQPRGEPRRRDPEDTELNVPGAADDIRKIIRQRDAVKPVTFDAVMGRDHPDRDLYEEQKRNDDEVLDGRFLRRRQRGTDERVGRRSIVGLGLFVRGGVIPDHRADAGK
jgi:hypothetical protein